MDFWMRLKSEIKAKNTTQEWIAGQIGVPFGTFRKWMTRKTYPNVKEGTEIAKLRGLWKYIQSSILICIYIMCILNLWRIYDFSGNNQMG